MSGLAPGAPEVAADHPEPPQTDLSPIADAVEDAGAAGFVAVGYRFADDVRYLSRFGGPDRDYAVVVTADRAALTAPGLFDEQAETEFVDAAPDDGVAREVRTEGQRGPAGRRAANVLDDLADADSDTVLTPADIPHDAALYLENAGYELSSTTAVDDARLTKTEAELACLSRVQAVTCRGMARAEAVLAAAEPDGDDLLFEGEPLTTEILRREVDAEMASHGIRSAGNTVIGSGSTAADLHYTGIDHIAPGETVLLDISPRGPHGYYGDLTRTFVVGSDGGWERRAFVAVEAAHEEALTNVEAGATAGTVHEEAAAELTAHGFRIDSSEVGFTHGVGHGVGVSLHEGPSLRADTPLQAGNVVTIEPGVYDPDIGGVRIEDLVAVTEDGYERLASYPVRFTPVNAE
ncbi:M24 family metallopeptidase [Halolamina litorea]|uniref:M24 family metallopeptidase n=1 Tax=Halolamina litorea TaxID=1515593 RepID=A0ABD6BPM1_9EURY